MTIRNAWLAAASLLVVACSGGDAGPTTGRLSLAVTDAPVDDATSVVVRFTGVEVKPADGGALDFDFDEPRSIDLLALQGGGSEILLEDVEVPAGRYNWVRLKVETAGTRDSYILLEDGSEHELVIPSGDETGLKLHSGFVVPAGGEADFTLDFDLRKSVHEPMNASTDYVLRPTLRIVDNTQVGAIAGTVAAEFATGDGCSGDTDTGAVYVFSGSSVTPDDVDTDATAAEPVTTALVTFDTASGEYRYRAAFLTAGDYTVTFTCDADDDDPATSDTLDFVDPQNATVVANETTVVNFAPAAPVTP